MGLKFNNSSDAGKNILLLLRLYEIMTSLLDSYFNRDGLIIANDGIVNSQYLVLCNRIEDLLRTASITTDEPWRPFDNLYVLDPDAPGLEWEYGGRDICYNFLSKLEELNIKYGIIKPPITSNDYELLQNLTNYLNNYKKFKREQQLSFMKQYNISADNGKNKNSESSSDKKEESVDKSIYRIKLICEKFPEVVKQLDTHRYNDRSPLIINDEYDVQYLLHALLKPEFTNIKKEEPNPSFLAKSTKSDFLLLNEAIIIETKMTREDHTDKTIGQELKDDLLSYKTNRDCKKLIFFIYDKLGRIKNPSGIQTDLDTIFKDYAYVFVYPK